jgi:hypothetical protein
MAGVAAGNVALTAAAGKRNGSHDESWESLADGDFSHYQAPGIGGAGSDTAA